MKFLCVMALLILVPFASTFAQSKASSSPKLMTQDDGIAVGIGYDWSGYGISGRTGNITLLLATKSWGSSISGDYIMSNERINSVKNLEWYAGVGGGAIVLSDSYFVGGGTAYSVRGSAGIAYLVNNNIELFTQASPSYFFGDNWSGFEFVYSSGARLRL